MFGGKCPGGTCAEGYVLEPSFFQGVAVVREV